MNSDLRFLSWRKSTYSSTNAECVEVAPFDVAVTAVRDSKDPGIGRLTVPKASWATFLAGIAHKA